MLDRKRGERPSPPEGNWEAMEQGHVELDGEWTDVRTNDPRDLPRDGDKVGITPAPAEGSDVGSLEPTPEMDPTDAPDPKYL